ncbi:hypothetical protein [Streptomyces oceani]|uniref:Uncharacterized protein n=1 Tax=Streptomyces oceani TaxID=1075402 RepID=A0A1E7JTW6_9ACTN|nr:hypothetical protein [Streptomyces oceani]OEU92317.1 hypothetical protein AN216_24660 [Streptomyces oceani]
MSRRYGESVPYTFVAQADRFRSNVTPPPRARKNPRERAGSVLMGLTIVTGLAGSLLLGVPALDADQQRDDRRQAASEGR